MLKQAPLTPNHNAHYELTVDDMAAGFDVALITGPIDGIISIPSGASYDVTEDIIPVKSEHLGELHLAIHKAHHAAGRFTDIPVPSLESVSVMA